MTSGKGENRLIDEAVGEKDPEVLVVMFLRGTSVAQWVIARGGGTCPKEGDGEDCEERGALLQGKENTNAWE